MAYFPFYMDVKDKKCIIGGAGKIACNKAKTMLEFGAAVTVIGEQICDTLEELAHKSELAGGKYTLKLVKKKIEKIDIQDADFVIMATDCPEVNTEFAKYCREMHILVNVVDVKEECDFYFPAIIKQDEVVVSVTTGGSSPALAAQIKKDIGKNLNQNYGKLANCLSSLRDRILEEIEDPKLRKNIWQQLVLLGMKNDGKLTESQIEQGLQIEEVEDKTIRIGTRGSKLALIQTDMVIDLLQKKYPEYSYEKVIIKTKGDKLVDKPLLEFGGKAVFVEEIEQGILDGTFDLAVHSAKDLPAQLCKGTVIAGVLERADARDVLITRKNHDIMQMESPVVGTSSLRRQYQIREMISGAVCEPLRGNVNTRIQKLKDGQYDAIILAAAGIQRMQLDSETQLSYRYLDYDEMIPAGCQGIIAIQTRESGVVKEMTASISDSISQKQFTIEREILEKLEVGCHEPVGVFSQIKEQELTIQLMRFDGEKIVRRMETGEIDRSESMIEKLCAGLCKENNMGKVYLVGAGPGDPGLITVKGLSLIQKCDAIIYDRLASYELLEYLREDCVKIFVGKEPGKHYCSQEETNEILVNATKKYETVVRLKGGDPFVFGRGGEEAEVLLAHGVDFSFVPGVTSAIAVPETAGIPVTHRGVSRSFHVITGHVKDENDSVERYKLLANQEGTLVFLMSMQNIQKIMGALMDGGKNPMTPVAVISEGTTASARTVRGTVATIVDIVKENQITSPAIIVVGQTAECSYQSPYKEQLLGINIGITATKAVKQKLASSLARQGANCYTVCDMKIDTSCQDTRFADQLMKLEEYEWVMFTSQNAIQIFFDTIKEMKIDMRSISHLKYAVVGSGTRDMLDKYGILADFMPDQYTTQALATQFCEQVHPDRKVMLARAKQGSTELTKILQENQIVFDDITLYDVKGQLVDEEVLHQKTDVFVFLSASGVTVFCEQMKAMLRSKNKDIYEKDSLQDYFSYHNIKIACLGQVTAAAFEKEGISVDIIPKKNDIEGLVQAILQQYRQEAADD